MAVLRGQQCTVRPWRTSDADALVRHANNLNVARQLRDRFPHPYTRRHASAFLKYAAGASGAATNFAIDVSGESVGGIGFVPGSDIERYSCEIGYWLGEEYWGRGIVTEALSLLTAHLFERVNMLRVYALPFADNRASIRVLEKAAYVREATLRASSVKFGEPRDQALFAKINPEWRADGSTASTRPPVTGPEV
jgi:ribosomal-protein-alanine N-acetyltransferase